MGDCPELGGRWRSFKHAELELPLSSLLRFKDSHLWTRNCLLASKYFFYFLPTKTDIGNVPARMMLLTPSWL